MIWHSHYLLVFKEVGVTSMMRMVGYITVRQVTQDWSVSTASENSSPLKQDLGRHVYDV